MQAELAEVFGCLECLLQPAEFAATGRGMACTRAVARGERLLALPLHRCWTEESARATPELRDLPEGIDQRTLMALHLAIERAKGTSAPPHRKSHIALLPDEPDTLLSWEAAEREALRGSKWYMVATACLEDIQLEFEALQDAIGHDVISSWGVDAYNYMWAQRVLLSRAIKIQQEGGEFLDLLGPLHDLLNHGGEDLPDDVRVETVQGTPCLCVYAARTYAAGEEALYSYSPSSNGRLLFGGGFVLLNNLQDCVELTLTLPCSADTLPEFQQLGSQAALPNLAPGDLISEEVASSMEFLELPDVSHPSQVVVHWRLGSNVAEDTHRLLPFLRLAVDPEHTCAQGELRAWELLRRSLEQMLAGYPTDISEDEAEFAALQGDLSSRRAKALYVVLCEKRIFLAARGTVLKQLTILLETSG